MGFWAELFILLKSNEIKEGFGYGGKRPTGENQPVTRHDPTQKLKGRKIITVNCVKKELITDTYPLLLFYPKFKTLF